MLKIKQSKKKDKPQKIKKNYPLQTTSESPGCNRRYTIRTAIGYNYAWNRLHMREFL